MRNHVSECLGMWLSKIRTQRDHPPGQHDLPSSQRVGQGQDFFLYVLAVVRDRVVHRRRITNMLLIANAAFVLFLRFWPDLAQADVSDWLGISRAGQRI
jgi:hypothetical protein